MGISVQVWLRTSPAVKRTMPSALALGLDESGQAVWACAGLNEAAARMPTTKTRKIATQRKYHATERPRTQHRRESQRKHSTPQGTSHAGNAEVRLGVSGAQL